MNLFYNGPKKVNAADSLAEAGEVMPGIYDMRRNIVKILIDHYQSADQFSLHLDISDIPAGIYYCRLGIDGKFIDTHKLVLVWINLFLKRN